ncbi:hypothetical protein [Rhodopirellula bahusiensis]|uniref:Uncharacterized protein n=1 Tax=Rhodopirellula bahusiensis TaxID=2014065 RepID=A0A2G1VYW5_9BACT|nr:hypothetical protein [Rhodopirellula bahusiensis]PHQ31800.1 hypothetical protein CEE69_28915 [Rhodopirellula bahusiensis]
MTNSILNVLVLAPMLLFVGCQSRDNVKVAERPALSDDDLPAANDGFDPTIEEAKAVEIASASPQKEETVKQPKPLEHRDIDLYRHLISELDEPSPDRVYFLTLTPMDDWGEHGNWMPFPKETTEGIPIAGKYRLDTGNAHLVDGTVLQKGKQSETWMEWITIKRWISDTEADVETGVWCCPLGGGASTATYKKLNGKWNIVDLGASWVS